MADDSLSLSRFLEVFGSLFPGSEWPQPKRALLFSSLRFREMEPGQAILREGQACSSVPFVIEGSIRVFKAAESGREVTLYRIERGQSCILSASCGRGIASFPASVVAEERCFAAFFPIETVRRLLSEGPSFRDFVLDQYSSRMAEVMELVEEIAFRHVDERLAEWLASEASKVADRRVAATHQSLADHLGTSREVVSRILKDWESRGALSIGRGTIALAPAFERLLLR
jgi:cAMP-binding proteins - catabolite gene activator and regulatory subunit of cAMP-dependent protein kinases